MNFPSTSSASHHNPHKRSLPLTELPPNLDVLSKHELKELLTCIAAEREELSQDLKRTKRECSLSAQIATELQRRTISSHPALYNTSTSHLSTIQSLINRQLTNISQIPRIVPPTRPIPPPCHVSISNTKKRISEKSIFLIKKNPHNSRRKPYTELTESFPFPSSAISLFHGYEPISNTSRIIRWKFESDKVHLFLNCAKYVHPVKFDGEVLCFARKTQVYAWAGYESMEAKFERKSLTLTLKFRTFLAGTGRPEFSQTVGEPPSIRNLFKS